MRIKLKLFTIAAILFYSTAAHAGLRAYLNFSIFNSTAAGPYIETYISVDGTSAAFVPLDNGLYQCAVEVTLIFHQGENIIEFDKYELKSNPIADTSSININILDQQRYFLPEGDYELEIFMQDLNTEDDPLNAIQAIRIDFHDEEVGFSGIELIDSIGIAKDQNILTKCGYDLIPWVPDYYPANKDRLIFYAEIYNTEKYFGTTDMFLIKCYIVSFESGLPLPSYVYYKRTEAKEIYPFINEFDISNLPTGNYQLVLEVRDRENRAICSNSLFFQRINPDVQIDFQTIAATLDISNTFASKITSKDILDEYIRSLAPKATQTEQFFIYKRLDISDLVMKQKFFYNFWLQRNPGNPEEAWKAYNALVEVVNNKYSTQIAKGYDTDRGRVYLKYGPPNIISESYNEPSSYPYEIWQYYRLANNQSNKRFVFYSHDNITNNFSLLHSDAIGEVSNYRWQIVLNQRWFNPYNLDIEQPPSIWGSEAEDYYRNPR